MMLLMNHFYILFLLFYKRVTVVEPLKSCTGFYHEISNNSNNNMTSGHFGTKQQYL